MICQTCDGMGYIRGVKTMIDCILRQESYVACPDCIGGVSYCCDGDRPPFDVDAEGLFWLLDESDTKDEQK